MRRKRARARSRSSLTSPRHVEADARTRPSATSARSDTAYLDQARSRQAPPATSSTAIFSCMYASTTAASRHDGYREKLLSSLLNRLVKRRLRGRRQDGVKRADTHSRCAARWRGRCVDHEPRAPQLVGSQFRVSRYRSPARLTRSSPSRSRRSRRARPFPYPISSD